MGKDFTVVNGATTVGTVTVDAVQVQSNGNPDGTTVVNVNLGTTRQHVSTFRLATGTVEEVTLYEGIPQGPWPGYFGGETEYFCGDFIEGEGRCTTGETLLGGSGTIGSIFFTPLSVCSYLPTNHGCFAGKIKASIEFDNGYSQSYTCTVAGSAYPLCETEFEGELEGDPPYTIKMDCEGEGIGDYGCYWFIDR